MNTIPALFLHRVTESPDRISAWAPTPDPDDQFFLESAPHDPTAPEGWTAATHAQTHRLVAGLAKRLQSLGVGRGVPVAILAQTSERWTLADMAVQCLGGITVGLYPTLTDAAVVATLSSMTPVALLPLIWIVTRQRPALLAWVGAGLAGLGTALLLYQ